MKFLGSFLVIALLNLIAVFAGPPPHDYVVEGDYEYFIQYDGSNQAYITNVLNKKATTLYINPYFYHNNVKYDVMALTGGLTNTAVTKLVIPHYIYHDFSIWDNVLKEAKHLKELSIQSLNNVTFYENTFTGCSENLQITGQGVENTIKKAAKQYLRDNYPDLIRDYSRTSSYEKKCAFYQIAKIVNKNWKYYMSAYGDVGSNGASTFFLKKGSMYGLARVTRYLAVAANLSEFEIQVGGYVNHGVNFVYITGGWHVLDVARTYFDPRASCESDVFSTLKSYASSIGGYYGKGVKVNPSEFVVYHTEIGFPTEYANPEKESFQTWVSQKGRGTKIAN